MDPVYLRRRALMGSGALSLMTGLAAMSVTASAAGRAAAHQPASRVAPQQTAPLPLVVLDPGHGGKDPGAIGITGTYEKHVAFAAATELQRQIQAERRVRVELTRLQDVFIPLEERVGWAQRRGAALFVSMHADAVGDHTVRGASIYTLSDTASDPQTAALAQRENSADRYAGAAFANQPPEVAHILASLVRQETRAGSVRLQRGLVASLDHDLPMLQNPARHASFVVLKSRRYSVRLGRDGFHVERARRSGVTSSGAPHRRCLGDEARGGRFLRRAGVPHRRVMRGFGRECIADGRPESRWPLVAD